MSRRRSQLYCEKLKKVGTCKFIMAEKSSDALFEIPVRLNKIGFVLLSSFNPAAAAAEAGIEVTCKAMSGLVPIDCLKRFDDVMRGG